MSADPDGINVYTLKDIPHKRILGRTIQGAGTTEDPLPLFWGASGLELNIKAKEIWINFSSDYEQHEAWVAVEVNGAPTMRFMAPKNSTWICIARQLNTEKEHLITILKDTQAMSSDKAHVLYINQVGLNNEGSFLELKPRSMKLEVIGDSITSGEGLAGGVDEMDWIPQWFSTSKTYEVTLAKNLDAELSVVSQSGWGIGWGWNGDLNAKIPPHYENVCSLLQGELHEKLGTKKKFDFGDGADFVVVNLGTNDNGAFYQPAWVDENGVSHELNKDENGKAEKEGGDKVTEGVYDFLKAIRNKNPKAKIIWVHGMIKISAIFDYLKEGIDKYKNDTKDEKVYLLELDCMDDVERFPEDKGSRAHPGPATHRKAAEKLTKFIKSLI